MAPAKDTVRLAAAGDLHCTKSSQGALQSLFAQVAGQADVLLLCGDLTDYGLPEEAHILARELSASVKIPVIAVLGNHDFHSDKQDEIKHILADMGTTVLDGDACEVHGVGFAGVKGFVGGFGRGTLAPWGEPAIRHFVHEAIEEALKLEGALARLRTENRIALLHYAPIQATVEGEPMDIYPFMGCSRLEEPLNRFALTAVFHGHAHHGSPEGRLSSHVPVYNVALPLLRRAYPDRPPYRLPEVRCGQRNGAAEAPSPVVKTRWRERWKSSRTNSHGCMNSLLPALRHRPLPPGRAPRPGELRQPPGPAAGAGRVGGVLLPPARALGVRGAAGRGAVARPARLFPGSRWCCSRRRRCWWSRRSCATPTGQWRPACRSPSAAPCWRRARRSSPPRLPQVRWK
jgi:Icc-related predicted phosphoesterase